jgi:hypothetical protein
MFAIRTSGVSLSSIGTGSKPSPNMLTIKTTDTQHTFIASIVDAAGAIVTGATGYIFTWSTDDKGVLVSTATVGERGSH